jgi:hypothetical protein
MRFDASALVSKFQLCLVHFATRQSLRGPGTATTVHSAATLGPEDQPTTTSDTYQTPAPAEVIGGSSRNNSRVTLVILGGTQITIHPVVAETSDYRRTANLGTGAAVRAVEAAAEADRATLARAGVQPTIDHEAICGSLITLTTSPTEHDTSLTPMPVIGNTMMSIITAGTMPGTRMRGATHITVTMMFGATNVPQIVHRHRRYCATTHTAMHRLLPYFRSCLRLRVAAPALSEATGFARA